MQKAQAPFRRRDGSGHLDPDYERMLRAGSGRSVRRDQSPAFVGRQMKSDPVAEERGSDFLATVTSGQDDGQELLDRSQPEEQGGPFVETSARTELAYDKP